MGWMPALGHCSVCGLALDDGAWYSVASDGVTCADDRRGGSVALSAESVALAGRMFRGSVKELAGEEWAADFKGRGEDLRRFAIEVLERNLEGRIVSARVLGRE
jgi:DNA repair protein RecO (recombination protein O)